MKKLIIGIIAASAIIFTACNSNESKSGKEDMSKMDKDTSKTVTADTTQIAVITPAYSNVDPKLSASIKAIFDHYLHIKNALVNNDQDEAQNGGKAMYDAMAKVDKSLFTPDQKKLYDGIEDDLKEHAEHIGKSKIDHQREHFAMMSEDIYDLAKAFGAGRVVYHNHCPMANDNKGAMWLTETKEVKNPYFGGKMNECVKVPEVIK